MQSLPQIIDDNKEKPKKKKLPVVKVGDHIEWEKLLIRDFLGIERDHLVKFKGKVVGVEDSYCTVIEEIRHVVGLEFITKVNK